MTEDDCASSNPVGSVIDLSLKKVVDPKEAAVGSTVKFTLFITNSLAGGATATNVQVTDNLPSGFTLVSTTASQGTFAGGIWTVGTLFQGQTETLVLFATALSSGYHTNVAQVSAADQRDFDSSPGNCIVASDVFNEEDDCGVATGIVFDSADLELSKSAFYASPIATGSAVSFTVSVLNLGPSVARGVYIRDIAENLAITKTGAVTVSAGSYDEINGIWYISSVPVSTTYTLVFSGTLQAFSTTLPKVPCCFMLYLFFLKVILLFRATGTLLKS